jgi:hypothetical protein
MADGDIIHNQLARLYQKPYKWLCEGKASSDECGQIVMQALKEDLKRKGDLPVKLAQRLGECISRTILEIDEAINVNWTALNTKIERIVQQMEGQHYLKELVLRASKNVLHEYRYGQEVDARHASESIVQQYMREVYESEFKERIPLASEHHAGVEATTLAERIEGIQSFINMAIDSWAKKANLDCSVAKLRLPPRRQICQIDMDEDLCIAS